MPSPPHLLYLRDNSWLYEIVVQEMTICAVRRYNDNSRCYEIEIANLDEDVKQKIVDLVIKDNE